MASRDAVGPVVTYRYPRSPAAEAYRMLRTSLSFLAPQEGLRTILVTSAGMGEGKTVTAANLAVALAQAGRQVLLIDADLRLPGLGNLFGVPQAVGLSNVLVRAAGASEAVALTEVPGVDLLPSGPVPPNPAELLARSDFEALLAAFKREYDRIVIDTPPVLTVSDATTIAGMVDGVLLVAEAGITRREALADAKKALEQVGGRVVGVVLNKMARTAAGGHYDYYGYYGAAGARARPARAARAPELPPEAGGPKPAEERVAASHVRSALPRLAGLGRWGQDLVRSLGHRLRTFGPGRAGDGPDAPLPPGDVAAGPGGHPGPDRGVPGPASGRRDIA